MVQSYMDNAGLYQKYGVDQATPKVGGEYKNFGQLREIELKLTLASLTQAETIVDDTVFFPAGMIIQEVIVETTAVAATGVAIDLGMIRTDRTTEIDYDGILAAFPLASMDSAGEQTTLTKGSTFAGALIGATTTNVGHITCSATTSAVFTTGIVVIKIRYYKP